MKANDLIAIVGGGPSGALAGAILASAGRTVTVFDEKLAWEKPCGGGVTFKALQQYPFLSNATAESNSVEQCELISPSGQRVRFRMQHPVAMFSRFKLNGMLLDRARGAGAEIRHERVTGIGGVTGDWRIITSQGEYPSSYLVLAGGARNSQRARFVSPIAPIDLMVTAGYFIPGRFSLMQIQFLKGITGYIWVFPRPDHISAGIACKMGEISTAGLRRLLEQWLAENRYSLEGATFFSHILPSFTSDTMQSLRVSGDGWATVGDSAGLVDPITGEGLYYALRSAELCAQALLEKRPELYQERLEDEILPDLRLAARVSQRFYGGQVFGATVSEQMVALTAKTDSFRELMSDLFAGTQGYRDLKSRLYRILPSVMAEGLAGALFHPWSPSSDLSTDSVAE
jgi:flavin-dependent dehydrogenase